jgi:RHH-type proline utilization regulon transcriptional repressor/proline dehydrogenase/delta 1-pyrroline-5-carboxylate dehydrogenase
MLTAMQAKEVDQIAGKAVQLAADWQDRANEMLTHEEKIIQEQMLRLLTHPLDKVILTKLIDQSFRSHNPARIADQVNSILRQFGVPDFFTKVDRLLVQMFLGLGRRFPTLTVPKMIDKMRQNSSRAVIAGEPDSMHEHLERRRKQGVRMNINHLGEALLGEAEARRRLAIYIADLKNPAIEYISVKISTIYSQISTLAWEHTIDILVERFAQLYRTAAAHVYTRIDGTKVPKFVNLDMEEYRDLHITVAAFQRTLDQPEFKNHSAGIVLQAYLPDSFDIQKQLTEWAQKRVAAGGSPIKLRIVKGANMEMEQVEAAINNWPLAPYDNKLEVDANYKRMVTYGMDPQRIRAVNLGIASHNLFELAFAHELGHHNRVTDYFYFEMLEGMADHVRRALAEKAGDVLLYAPVATKEEFINAIAYLVRRLDENTAPDNFLRYAPKLSPSSKEWSFLEDQFLDSCRMIDKAGTRPHRIQNRQREVFPEKIGTYHENQFVNESDTDWTLVANRQWAESIRTEWKKTASDAPLEIPIVVDDQQLFDGREIRDCIDSSQYHDHIVVARYALANDADVERAVSVAVADPGGWRRKNLKERHAILSGVARELRRSRGDLIGAAAANTGKVFTEADVEVSEAVDFADYYPYSARNFVEPDNIASRGKGVGCVISPWNFPIAIPCGGIVASLAAGNTVIFKPSSDAVLVAWILCQCFWRAGVSKNTLQFLPCSGSQAGRKLVNHKAVDSVILTGGTETGLTLLSDRPDLFLSAETGGKNATIVTAVADRDQAIKNIIHSAFSNCGQKCSATSLLILEKEVFEDEHFKRQLVDAAESMIVGSAWDFQSKMGPLIRPPAGELKRGIEQLETGESWALKPRNIESNPYLWTPGIKWDVVPGSFTHTTELFGPVLGVMRAESLEQAVDLVNATGFGLTSGLESLDRREQDFWKEHIRAGNLYINRGTTGAVTLRQPFGGMRKSALGPAIKAGSPNYVSQFMLFKENGFPRVDVIKKDHALLRLAQEWQRKANGGAFQDSTDDIRKTIRAIKSYLYHVENEFSQEIDYFHLRGQDNILRYLPVGRVMVRIHAEDNLFDVLARIAAVRISGCELMISVEPGVNHPAIAFLRSKDGSKLAGNQSVVVQTDREVIDSLSGIQRIRYADPRRVPTAVFKAAAKTGYYIARSPVLMEGRIELLHYYVNQSICDAYHRYGNLGERSTI